MYVYKRGSLSDCVYSDDCYLSGMLRHLLLAGRTQDLRRGGAQTRNARPHPFPVKQYKVKCRPWQVATTKHGGLLKGGFSSSVNSRDRFRSRTLSNKSPEPTSGQKRFSSHDEFLADTSYTLNNGSPMINL